MNSVAPQHSRITQRIPLAIVRDLSAIWLLFATVFCGFAATPNALFLEGLEAYRAGNHEIACYNFGEAANVRPSAGALLNLGLAEWQRGRVGRAIQAWEQAAWVNPLDKAAKNNLAFARKAAQLDSPYLAWHEVASSWLPASWWAWLTGLSLWSAIGAAMLPSILRLRRNAWHQGVAAFGLALFLLSLPAHMGVASRAHFGYILERDTPLRLTPTRDAQHTTKLAEGEPVRWKRTRGNYLLVNTRRAEGWVERRVFGPVVPGQIH